MNLLKFIEIIDFSPFDLLNLEEIFRTKFMDKVTFSSFFHY